MKVIILAGGLPSTVNENDEKIPKPMAEIGARPILWHIIKHMSQYGLNDFIVCAGYKGELLKQYFMDYYIYQSDITVDLKENKIEILRKKTEDWNVTVVDTGKSTSVMKRIAKARDYIGDETLVVAYGDCVSDIDYERLIKYHKEQGKCATIVVAKPAGRHEILPIAGAGNMLNYGGISEADTAWVNACVYIFEPEVFAYMQEYSSLSEPDLFRILSEKGQLVVYKHSGFWLPMETMRDRTRLEQMWDKKTAPWRIWKDE